MAENPVRGRGREGRGGDGIEKARRGPVAVLDYKQQLGRQKSESGLVSEEGGPLRIYVDGGRHDYGVIWCFGHLVGAKSCDATWI